MSGLDLSKVTKGTLASLLNDLVEFAGTPKKDQCPKGVRRKAFHAIAKKAKDHGVVTPEDLGLSDKQKKLLAQGQALKSTSEQRQTLAAITVGAARRCGVRVPTVVETHFNL